MYIMYFISTYINYLTLLNNDYNFNIDYFFIFLFSYLFIY